MADQAQLQALNEHERNKKVSDLPAYYGVPGKDTITAKQLIRRVEQAATVCNWNDGQKALQLSITFKASALIWYEGLEKSHGLDVNDWAVLKKAFLENYEGLVSSTNLTLSLKDFQQRVGERVVDYGARGQAVFNHYYDQIMETSTNPADLNDAAVTAANTALIKKGMKFAARSAMVQLQISLYEAGLLEHLRLDVSQTKHKTLGEIQKAAIQAESRHAKPKRAQVNAVENLDYDDGEDDASAINAVELDTEQYADIAALHAARGKPMPSYYKRKPFAPKKKTSGNGNSHGSDKKDVVDCWHCGKKGHVIADCRSKKAGKPKAPGAGRKVAEIDTTMPATLSAINIESLNY